MKFSFHEFHVGLLGYHAVFVGVHEEEELPDVLLADGEAVLGLGDGGFLGRGGAENGDGNEEDQSGSDEFHLGRRVTHEELLRDGVPRMV